MGLGRAGLGWVGLNWVERGWVASDWVGLEIHLNLENEGAITYPTVQLLIDSNVTSTDLTIYSRLPENDKQNGFFLYVFCCLVIRVNFSTAKFFKNPVPLYDKTIAFWQHLTVKG